MELFQVAGGAVKVFPLRQDAMGYFPGCVIYKAVFNSQCLKELPVYGKASGTAVHVCNHCRLVCFFEGFQLLPGCKGSGQVELKV